jgi:taurine dioxygenase
VSNAIENGAPIGVRRAGERWHSDICYSARPPRGKMLYALEIPELHGLPLGDTEFASAAAPWDALPEPTQRHIYGKRAFPPTQVEIDRHPPLSHPVVRTHPVTGAGASTSGATTAPASRAWSRKKQRGLIATLADHIFKPAFIYRHQWQPSDLLLSQLLGPAPCDSGLRLATSPPHASDDDGWRRARLIVLYAKRGMTSVENLSIDFISTECGINAL